jgi:hypothetical protein
VFKNLEFKEIYIIKYYYCFFMRALEKSRIVISVF